MNCSIGQTAPSWHANSGSAREEKPWPLQNTEVHYRFHSRVPSHPVLRHTMPANTHTPFLQVGGPV